MPHEAPFASAPPLPQLDCACAGVRRAARLVTQLYSQEIGPAVEPTQFALLSAFRKRPGIGRPQLGRALGLDKTTLSRNLALMQRKGWITPSGGSLRARGKGYDVTRAGVEILAAATPGWNRAQDRLRSAFAPGEWETALKVLGRVAEAARDAAASAGEPAPGTRLPSSSPGLS